jgi:hypothetical protein
MYYLVGLREQTRYKKKKKKRNITVVFYLFIYFFNSTSNLLEVHYMIQNTIQIFL